MFCPIETIKQNSRCYKYYLPNLKVTNLYCNFITYKYTLTLILAKLSESTSRQNRLDKLGNTVYAEQF